MATAAIVAIALTILLPDALRPEPRWGPLVAGALLVGLIVADPGRVNRVTPIERVLSRAMLVLLMASTLTSTVLLIYDLVQGRGNLTSSAAAILTVGTAVWITNNIVFALLYWECDGGGSAARLQHRPTYPDLAFPQQIEPRLAPEGWRPIFIDYLYLGITNALAFSPTDVMPLVPWAKITMSLQSFMSVAVFGLVIARAVNIFK